MVRQGQVIGRVKDDRLALQTGASTPRSRPRRPKPRAPTPIWRAPATCSSTVAYAQARLDPDRGPGPAPPTPTWWRPGAQRGASAELGAQARSRAKAGRVLTADVPVGSVVTPGQTLANITAGPMVVRIELPEGQARALKVGDVVQLAAEDLRGLATTRTTTRSTSVVKAGRQDVSAPGLASDLDRPARARPDQGRPAPGPDRAANLRRHPLRDRLRAAGSRRQHHLRDAHPDHRRPHARHGRSPLRPADRRHLDPGRKRQMNLACPDD